MFHRLGNGLLAAEYVWYLNDVGRAAFTSVLSFAFLKYISYRDLKLKCIVAAFFGFSVADLLICIIWYAFDLYGYVSAILIQAALMCVMFMLYWFRSYDQVSDKIDDDSIYCLRRKPSSMQDFAISLVGSFGAYGGYVIVQNKIAYLFRDGELIKIKYDSLNLDKYHITKGKLVSGVTLDEYVGMKWGLFGDNCVTILGNYWARYG